MRKLLFLILAVALLLAVPLAGCAPRHEIESVAAFARLYGVVRYFYPSDAAAALDWNRFAVHGVRRVRTAQDAARLEKALKELFAPLGAGLEIARALAPASTAGPADDRLIAWRYRGAPASPGGGGYRGKRTNRASVSAPGIDGFVGLIQTLPGEGLRAKTIRLRGQVRASARGAGAAALWLIVDGQIGFLNMVSRPIRAPEWREYVIEGTVAGDASHVAFGVMASGEVIGDFDALELEVREADGRWTPLAIKDPGVEAGAARDSEDWQQVGTSTNADIAWSGEAPPQGQRFVRFSPRSMPASVAELFEGAAPSTGSHVDVDLGSGLKARVPLALSDDQARAGAGASSGLETLRDTIEKSAAPDTTDVDVRLADVVVVWNVLRHFYPYWSDAGVDWDTRLRPRLEGAYDASTREAHHDALRRLVADARRPRGG